MRYILHSVSIKYLFCVLPPLKSSQANIFKCKLLHSECSGVARLEGPNITPYYELVGIHFVFQRAADQFDFLSNTKMKWVISGQI